MAGGDARRALTALEAAAGVALERAAGLPTPTDPVDDHPRARGAGRRPGRRPLRPGRRPALRRRQRADQVDARPDVDAALHYLARMLEAGEDPRFVARRIVISASEDVGMGDPTALQTAVAAMHAVAQIGMPEARIILAQAVVHLAMAPKSNAAYLGINAAIADVRAGRAGRSPPTCGAAATPGPSGSATATGYVYSHDEPDGVAAQQYLPDDLAGDATTTGRPTAASRSASRRASRG